MGERTGGSWDGDGELQGIKKLLGLMKSLEFYCQLCKYLHFMTSTFPMALFRGAVSRDLSVMKLHCLMTSTTCLPPLCRGMCSGVLDLEGIGDMCVCLFSKFLLLHVCDGKGKHPEVQGWRL